MVAERCVSLVLCDDTGDILGALPSFAVDDPWWPEARPVVSAARERFAADVIVLRMLHVASDRGNGGDVTYLAELVGEAPPDLPLEQAPAIDDGEEPLRAAWARPGGVAETIAWADDALVGIGRPRVGPAEQIKTWNLSSVLRLPTATGDVWCKSVPPFLTHEGGIIELVGADEPTLVPPLLASDPAKRTVLLGNVPGADDWDAPAERLLLMGRPPGAAPGAVERSRPRSPRCRPARLACSVSHQSRRSAGVPHGCPRAAHGCRTPTSRRTRW